MSYCGACGGFYNLSCQRWPLCSPAPNPHEAALVAAAAQVVALAAQAAAIAGPPENYSTLSNIAEDARNIGYRLEPK